MYRLTIDPAELHVFMNGDFIFTIALDEYPELELVRQQIIEIVEQHRTPEQIARDTLIELAIVTDPDAVAGIIEEWRPGTPYRAGEHLSWGGLIYRVVQTHKSEDDREPQLIPALYTIANKTTTDPVETVPEWVRPTGAHDAYSFGDRVTFEGKTYESVLEGIRNNTWKPTEYPQAWKEIE